MPTFKGIGKLRSAAELLRDKSGYEYIEAAFVMPMTVLIVAAMLALMVFMFQDFFDQTQEHAMLKEEAYETSEVGKIRAYDKVRSEIEANL